MNRFMDQLILKSCVNLNSRSLVLTTLNHKGYRKGILVEPIRV